MLNPHLSDQNLKAPTAISLLLQAFSRVERDEKGRAPCPRHLHIRLSHVTYGEGKLTALHSGGEFEGDFPIPFCRQVIPPNKVTILPGHTPANTTDASFNTSLWREPLRKLSSIFSVSVSDILSLDKTIELPVSSEHFANHTIYGKGRIVSLTCGQYPSIGIQFKETTRKFLLTTGHVSILGDVPDFANPDEKLTSTLNGSLASQRQILKPGDFVVVDKYLRNGVGIVLGYSESRLEPGKLCLDVWFNETRTKIKLPQNSAETVNIYPLSEVSSFTDAKAKEFDRHALEMRLDLKKTAEEQYRKVLSGLPHIIVSGDGSQAFPG